MSGGLDLVRARVRFRDRSVADVLDLALRFIARSGRAYAKVGAATLVPLAVVALAAGWMLGWSSSWAVAVPLAIIAEIPFTVLASRLVFEEDVRSRDVLRAAVREAPRVLFVRLLSSVPMALGFFLFLIPGFWLAAIFFFITEVLLLERASIGVAFRRSARVAEGTVSEVIVGVLVLGLVPIASVLLADVAGRALVTELLQFRPPRSVWSEGGGALATLGLFAQAPYVATARFFLYLNVRTRAEGWDIQTRFAAIAARAQNDARAPARLEETA